MNSVTKNLYFKSWFLEPDEIEKILSNMKTPWKRIDTKFYFLVMESNYEELLTFLQSICIANGSMINESAIDFVQGTPEEIKLQINNLHQSILESLSVGGIK